MQPTSLHSLPVTNLPEDLLKDTKYQPDAPKGYIPSFQKSDQVYDHRKIDYRDNEFCITTLPQPYTDELERDGSAEIMCTGWFKRKVLSTPGFPSPIAHPPKVTFEVRVTDAANGWGIFATEDIKAGDLILAERPLIIRNSWISAVHDECMSDEEVQRAYFVDESLPNVFKTDGSGPLTGIYRSSSRDVGVEDPEGSRVPGGRNGVGRYMCVGALASRFKHDCAPSATYTFNMPSLSMEIHAVRPIAKGEEITLTYCHVMSTAAERAAKLKKRHFKCTCKACMNPAESDKERERVVKALLPKTSQGVGHAERILTEYEASGLQSQFRYVELLQRVAQIQRKKGNKNRAEELDKVADKIIIAQKGRNYVPEPEPKPTPPPHSAQAETPRPIIHIPIGSEQDLINFINNERDAVSRMNMINAFQQLKHRMRMAGMD